jgi:tetrahydromethanopterin S-methyltransferase subunit D
MPGFKGFGLITIRFIKGIINFMMNGGGGAKARPVLGIIRPDVHGVSGHAIASSMRRLGMGAKWHGLAAIDQKE